jgi:hypothetical protein
MKRKYVAESEMGRWNKKNLENLADSTEFTITVDDKISPTLSLISNSIEGKKGSNPEELAKSLVSIITDASKSFGYPIDTLIAGAQTPAFEDKDFYYYDVSISTKDVKGNESIAKQAEVKVKKNNTGIQELVQENKEIDIDVLGNSKFRVSSSKYLREGEIDIYNSLGQVIDKVRVNDLMPNEEREIEYSGFGNLKTGMYIVNFIGNNSRSSHIFQFSSK